MNVQHAQKLRAWWSHRQGLDGRLDGAAPDRVLERTGWARSVGGSAPYLALFARAHTSRETADTAVAKLEIHELPAARGCTYVVPRSDFALALQAGASFAGGEMKVAYKLGVTDKEVDKLCAAVMKALERGPLDPAGIREATGKASRSLGEEGKKKGLTTTLPLALGKLQASGDIRRVPVNGRLDQQRYCYTLWQPNPLAKPAMTAEEVNVELARHYFSWIGPATLEEFQWFSALTVKAAKAAIAALKLETLDTLDGGRMIHAADREQFEAFKIPRQASYVLVSGIDGLGLLRRDLEGLADADTLRLVTQVTGIEVQRGVLEIPGHQIFDRGNLVGLWEYDTATQSIAWAPFIAKNQDLERAVGKMEEFIRAQLGDARSFSLDSPKSRVPRIAALRRAAGR